MRNTMKLAAVACATLIWVACASAQATKQEADLTATDGVKLKVTYFSAGKPGPGVLLLHQCNRDRKSWDGLAMLMAQAGINVVTLDNRGFGESGGERADSRTPAQQAEADRKSPADIDIAYAYLLSQPGVDKARIGAGGASCGVNNAVHLAHRHPEVKTLVLLSGPLDDETIQFVEANAWMPILSAASEDDGDMLATMRWLMGFARNPQNRLLSYKAAGHGAEMFKVEKQLPPTILEWYQVKLDQPRAKEATKNSAKDSAIAQFWDTLMQPGGVARATKMLEDAKKKDPNVFLFPESAINFRGYQRIQDGKTKEAIEIFKLNELAYPHSANALDSLGDAYLADNQNELALKYSEKALKALDEYPNENRGAAQGVRRSAEDKIKKLKAK